MSRRICAALCLLATPWLSAPGHGHGFLPRYEQFPAGIPLSAHDGQRQIHVSIGPLGWQPGQIQFARDEEATFMIHNADQQAHLFVLGSTEAQRDQALMHRLMPEVQDDYPNTRHLPAGADATLSWRFNIPGTFSVRCLLPEHQPRQEQIILVVSDQ